MPTQVNPQRITKNTLPPYGRLLLIMAVSLYTSRVVLNTLRCLTEEPSGCPSPPRLSRYVNDGRFCIDNNLVENAIRPLALGRKNFLFCGNHDVQYVLPSYTPWWTVARPRTWPRVNGWRMSCSGSPVTRTTAKPSVNSCQTGG